MPSRQQLETALRNADAAGDTAAARQLATALKTGKYETETPTAPSPQQAPDQPPESHGSMDFIKRAYNTVNQAAANLEGGLVQGAADIGVTLSTPIDLMTGYTKSWGNPERRQAITNALQSLGVDTSSPIFQGGRLGTQVAGTAGIGGVAAKPVAALGAKVPALIPVANALRSGGMSTGVGAANIGQHALNALTRIGTGAATGGLQAGLVNPEEAETGAAVGGSLAGALPPVAKVLAKGAGFLTDLVGGKIAAVTAGNISREAAGTQINAIKAALDAAPADLTAAQATAGIPKTNAWQALQKIGSEGEEIPAILKRQVSERLGELQRIARGGNLTESQNAAEEAKRLLTQITNPMRESALNAANATRRLDAQPIIEHLREVTTRPGTRADQTVVEVARGLQQRLRTLARQNGGVLDAADLYTLRKTGVADVVERIMQGRDPNTTQKTIRAVLSEVRPMIDQAIEDAGGTGWASYMRTYSKNMHRIEQTQMAAKAARLFERNPKLYTDLVRGNNPKAVEAIFGPGNSDIFEEMAKHMPTLDKVARYAEANRANAESAQQGAKMLGEILARNKASFRLPNILQKAVTLSNKVLFGLEGHVNEKSLALIRKGTESGKSMSELLDMLPASERVKALRVIMHPETWEDAGAVLQSAAVQSATPNNSMAPSPQNNLRK